MLDLSVKPEYLSMLLEIFDGYCPNAQIWAYGSRLDGDFHAGSDLDLVVKDFGNNVLSLGKLKELLNDSNIPFLVDICEFKNLPESFQKEIMKKYIVLYPQKS